MDSLVIKAPQIIYLIFVVITTMVNLHYHGREKSEQFKHDAVTGFFFILGFIGLYAWGGFFHRFGWPQLVLGAMYTLSLLWMARKHGQQLTKTNFWITSASTLFTIFILAKGGFFGFIL